MADEKRPVGGSDLILKPIDIDMQRLFVEPEKNDTTSIASLMAKCVVPVRIGVLDVPGKILDHIKEIGRNSETILPLEAVQVYQTILRLENQMVNPESRVTMDNAIDIFTCEAVKSAPALVDKFTEAITAFCGEIESIQSQVASEKSFYMAQTLGAEVSVDPTLILTAAQNFVQSLNVIASGLDGYLVLALVQTIDSIGRFLDDPEIQKLYGVPNQTAMVNKLGFRILPGQVALHKQMSELLEVILKMEEGAELEKTALVRVFNLANQINKGVNQVGGGAARQII